MNWLDDVLEEKKDKYENLSQEEADRIFMVKLNRK